MKIRVERPTPLRMFNTKLSRAAHSRHYACNRVLYNARSVRRGQVDPRVGRLLHRLLHQASQRSRSGALSRGDRARVSDQPDSP